MLYSGKMKGRQGDMLLKGFIRTLRGKMFLVIILIGIPAISLIIWNTADLQKNRRIQKITETHREVDIYTTTVNTSFMLLEDLLLNMPMNSDSFDRLVNYKTQESRDSQYYWIDVRRVQKQIDSVKMICPYIEGVFAYYPEQELFINSKVNPQMTKVIMSDIENLKGKGTGGNRWFFKKIGDSSYIYRVYQYSWYALGVWVSCDDLLNFLDIPQDKRAAALADPDGKMLTSGISEHINLSDIGYGDYVYEPENGSENSMIIFEQTLHPGLYVAMSLTEAQLSTSWQENMMNIWITCILVILIITVVIWGISRWVLVPVRSLVEGIEKIGNGDIEYRFNTDQETSLEFCKIKEKFNGMMDQLKQIKIVVYEQEIQQQETKLRYLSQQIQPHFILNSLNTLYTYSKRDVEATRKIIRLLSEYYRYVVNVESRYVCLEQELDHIEKYLSLQKIRFPRTLSYQIDCEPALKIVPIPPFLLESFVGNALKYGLDEEDKICIHIEIIQEAHFEIKIRISDTGPGFSPEMLSVLNRFTEQRDWGESAGTGIKNSVERLKLIYHENAQIRFYNRVSNGAVVEILIHLQQEGEKNV